jgi:hypothetical protein
MTAMASSTRIEQYLRSREEPTEQAARLRWERSICCSMGRVQTAGHKRHRGVPRVASSCIRMP